MACCGDTPTLETLAAVDHSAGVSAGAQDPGHQCGGSDEARSPPAEHPHGLSDDGLRRPVHQG